MIIEKEAFLPTFSDIEQMHDLIAGRAVASAVYVAAKLGIADLLITTSKSVETLAQELQVNEAALYRLLRALSGIGVFKEESGLFSLTPMAACMRSDISNSLRPLIIMCGDPWHWTLWGGLIETVKTGEPYFLNHFGEDFFPFIKKHADIEESFHAAMYSLSSVYNEFIAKSYNFSNYNFIIDIGGGQGGLLLSIISQYKNINALLYDLPAAITTAKQVFARNNLLDRCKCLEGNFFETIPSAGELYIIKHVLHGLDHDRSVELLKRVYEAALSESRVLIIDMMMPGNNQPSYSKFNDLEMMLLSKTGGERTQQDFIRIFDKSKFKLLQTIPLPMGLYIFELKKLSI